MATDRADGREHPCPHRPIHPLATMATSASQVAAAARLASGAVRMALWPVTEAVVAAERLERVARAIAGDLAGRVALAVVDAVVASRTRSGRSTTCWRARSPSTPSGVR